MRRTAAASGVAVAICALVAFTRDIGSDWGNIDCHLRDAYCDDAQPALDALIHGRVHEFFANQPLMGPLTLALRAPFSALAGLDGYDPKLIFQLGSFACLLVLAAAAIYLGAAMRARGRPDWQQWLTGGAVLVNPMVFRALAVGHPEELVGAAMCLAAAVAVADRRWALAGAFIGGALTTKLWAVLLVPAVVLAAPDLRSAKRLCAAVSIVVVALYTPMVVGDAGRLKGAFEAANKLGTMPGSVTPANVWWFVGSEKTSFDRAAQVAGGQVVTEREVGYVLHRGLARVTHPVVVLLAALLGLLWARSADRRRQRPETLLLLAAVVFLIRCVLDPGNSSYYHLPVVVALAGYEGLARRGFPWLTAFVIAWLQVITWLSPHLHSDAGFGVLYLGFALPTLALLLFWLFRVESGANARVRRGVAVDAAPSTAS